METAANAPAGARQPVTVRLAGGPAALIEIGGLRLLTDPVLDAPGLIAGSTRSPARMGGPGAAVKGAGTIHAVLLSHGHGDHLGDAVPIAQRDRAPIVATYELAQFCEQRGAAVHAMHIAGAHQFPLGRVKLVPAFHGGRAQVVVLRPGQAHTLS